MASTFRRRFVTANGMVTYETLEDGRVVTSFLRE